MQQIVSSAPPTWGSQTPPLAPRAVRNGASRAGTGQGCLVGTGEGRTLGYLGRKAAGRVWELL